MPSRIVPYKYDKTNPRPRATTRRNVLDHGDATRLHCKHNCPSFSRAVPFIWSMTDSKVGISPEYDPYQNPRPCSGFDNTDIGASLSHVSLYHTKLLSRTYLYDFVCNVTRFTHLVTSHCIRHRVPQQIGTNKR